MDTVNRRAFLAGGAAALAGVYCMMAALFAILGVVGLLGDGEVSLALRALLALAGAANLWAMVFVFAAVGSEPRASAQP